MLLEVGRVTKPHGIRGQVIVEVTSNRPERWLPGTRVNIPNGSLEIVQASPAAGRASGDHTRWIVAFAGITDREGAEALRGLALSAAPLEDPDALWVHDLVGSEVVDATGMGRGRVTSVQSNPASDLLVLDTGALVPLRFVVSSRAGRVSVEVPDGLFDL
ncbi:MAG: ribosome maturation factor RimM [Actinomycetota bacterium]|nr:ribosome maturation factor RimM [Actinomycetota bacterium]